MPAPKNISLLFIEDSPYDAELAQLSLERSGYTLSHTERVYDHQGVVEALQRREFDLILADFILPGFSGSQALQLARDLAPQTPFIFLSGVFGEENAVNMMRSGAVDYVLKQNLGFLPKAVERALSEVNERRRRVEAEQTLREVEARARLAIDAARLGMWDYEPKSGTLIWDERSRAMFGLAADTAVNMELLVQLSHSEDREALLQQVQRALSQESSGEFCATFRVLLGNGRTRWIESRGQAFFEDGVCTRFLGVMMDITEQQLATQSLKRLNETLGERVEKRTRERDRTWELSRDLLAVTQLDMMPIALNPIWEHTLGWPLRQLMQRSLAQLVHPDDLQESLEETARIGAGKVTNRFVNRLRHRDGSHRWFSWSAVADGDRIYWAARDITSEIAAVDKLAEANRELRAQIQERKRVEATLQQMQRLEAVGQLTAGVAHDFNNLLTVILTSTSFLQNELESGAPAERSLRRLQYIREAGERGATLTSQLLAFARRQQLAPTAVNLNDTLVALLSLLKSTLGGNVRIETDMQTDLWHALVDPTQIEMIILNLAINARDAMGVSGQLTLGTHNMVVDQPALRAEDPAPGDYVVLSVTDTGGGMSEEVLSKAFEPFFTTKEVGKGSGLGLAQVFGFAKQSSGGARIHSQLGVGTTVQVFLPRTAAPQKTTPHVETSVLPFLGGQRILLADDDRSVREVTAQMLQSLGFAVTEAESGNQALQLLAEGIEVDLLLADFAMPGMNGGELARTVRTRYPALPVVIVTGYAELSELGLAGYPIIQKPFREEQLASRIQLALREGSLVNG